MTLGSRGSAQGWALGLGEGAPAFSGRSGARLLCLSQDFSPTPGLEVETEQPSPLSADPGSGCPGGGTGLPAVPWAQGYGGEREGTSGPAGRWAGLRKGLGRVRVSRAPGAALGARDREEPAQPGGQTPTPHPRSIPSWSPNPQPPHIAHSLLSPAKPPSVAMATGAEKAGGAWCFPLFPAPSAGRGLRAGRRLQPPPASEPPPPGRPGLSQPPRPTSHAEARRSVPSTAASGAPPRPHPGAGPARGPVPPWGMAAGRPAGAGSPGQHEVTTATSASGRRTPCVPSRRQAPGSGSSRVCRGHHRGGSRPGAARARDRARPSVLLFLVS